MAAFRRMGKTELFTHFAERFGIGWNILVQPEGPDTGRNPAHTHTDDTDQVEEPAERQRVL